METIDMGALRTEQSRLIDARKTLAEQAVQVKSLPAEQQSVALDQLEATNANLKAELDAVNAQIKSVNGQLMFGGDAIDQQAMQLQQKSHRGGLLGSPMAVNEKGWRHFLAGATAGQPMRIDLGNAEHRKAFSDITTKTGFDGATSGSGVGSGIILPTVFPPVPQPLEETRVGDLFAHQAISTPTWEYLRHNTTTGGPAVTAEGAVKPAVNFGLDVVTGKVSKIAATYSYSYELARDFDSFVGQMIPSELSRVMIDAESRFLLGTAPEDEPVGTTPGDGLLGAAGLTYAVPSSDTAAGSAGLRALNHSVAMLRSGSSFAKADTIVLSPNTYAALRGATDSMGRFLLTEAAGPGDIPQIWGMRVCQTTMIADGTVLVCDSTQYARVVVREGFTMFVTNQGAELMSTNMIMTVVEQRLGLEVPRPTAGLVLTGVVG